MHQLSQVVCTSDCCGLMPHWLAAICLVQLFVFLYQYVTLCGGASFAVASLFIILGMFCSFIFGKLHISKKSIAYPSGHNMNLFIMLSWGLYLSSSYYISFPLLTRNGRS